MSNWLVRVRGIGVGAHWPTFNLADVFIVAGVVLIFIRQFFASSRADNPKT